MSFQSAGASATGRGHREAGTGCEDAYRIIHSDPGVVACVCDGAGSAPRSAEGADTLATNVCQAVADGLTSIQSPELAAALINAIQETRDQLGASGSLVDFHATLCGIAMTREQSLVFHLGDGVVFGIDPDDWTDYVVSEPENGEFAETTYFFTLPGWQSHLRIFTAPQRYRTWFLMTDGCASFAARTSPWRPTPNFMVPVHRHLKSLPDTPSRELALLNTLQSPQTDRITADDKTLVWINADLTD